ncbi:hypothetical protein AQUCO_01400572v1 [Aquilegia coerulea]|uniref:Bifunctional inhibitor/plant lipid transfer protein/seed storage helical domain-containing protein n=1 Tax=Aquilegia coerulea TaxID=218851 RepID=A0A2G5DXU3_AQUCA|nr:hypothetical protein AQUCO_01400572v1 [Aquilegia coerulea]
MVKVAVILCVLALWGVCDVNCATKSAPAPSQDCSTLILGMTDCLPFVTSGDPAKKPEVSVAPAGSPAVSPKSSAASPKASAASPKSPVSLAPTSTPPSLLPGGALSPDGPSVAATPGATPAKSGASTMSISFVVLVGMVVALYSHI